MHSGNVPTATCVTPGSAPLPNKTCFGLPWREGCGGQLPTLVITRLPIPAPAGDRLGRALYWEELLPCGRMASLGHSQRYMGICRGYTSRRRIRTTMRPSKAGLLYAFYKRSIDHLTACELPVCADLSGDAPWAAALAENVYNLQVEL